MRYAVIQLTQNSQWYYLAEFKSIQDAFKQALGASIEWFFVENNSTDQTVSAAQRYGRVLSLNLPPITMLTGRCTNRTSRLAFLRNKALAWVREFGEFDYIIWLDTNVSCTAATLKLLLQTMQRNPDIGLACANTLERGQGLHYYDTYALNQTQCLWAECTLCHGPYAIDSIVDVPSAFGGLCFLRGNIPCTFAATFNQCEHVYMCTKLKEKGYRVVVVGPARATWW
jgi:hypothetical protein